MPALFTALLAPRPPPGSVVPPSSPSLPRGWSPGTVSGAAGETPRLPGRGRPRAGDRPRTAPRVFPAPRQGVYGAGASAGQGMRQGAVVPRAGNVGSVALVFWARLGRHRAHAPPVGPGTRYMVHAPTRPLRREAWCTIRRDSRTRRPLRGLTEEQSGDKPLRTYERNFRGEASPHSL